MNWFAMCCAPRDGSRIIACLDIEDVIAVAWYEGKWISVSGHEGPFNDDDLLGWILFPEVTTTLSEDDEASLRAAGILPAIS